MKDYIKITEIILENFAAIDNAMSAKKIRIDFTKAKNTICLLIGPNGAGKTTILSLLTPFADLGNLDVRNGNNLILKNKDGYKEIHIDKTGVEYVIKHFYTHHKDKNHSVKSYIEKDGVELNPNGNVTSFKELVSMELNIEPDYLKLIRLGKNVTSLIDMTSTERKNYMSRIMDDIGIYLEYYKNINNKLRQLDDMISHTIHKIDRLEIIDEDKYLKEMDELKSDISIQQGLYLDETNKGAVANATISSINNSGTIAEDYKKACKLFDKMSTVLARVDDSVSLDAIPELTRNITELEKKELSLENEQKTNTLLIENTLVHLNDDQEELRICNIELQKAIDSESELDRLDSNLKDMKRELRVMEASIDGFKPPYSKKEFDEFIVFIKNVQQVLTRTYGFGKKPIKKVIELMRKNKNVLNYINSHLLSIDDENDDKGSLFISKISKELLFKGNEPVVIECDIPCKARELFTQIQAIVSSSEVDDKREDVTFYKDMEYVFQNLIAVLPRFNEYEFIIKLLPDDIQEFFKLDVIYNNIIEGKFIYDEKKLNDLLALVTEYYNYEDLLLKYEEAKSHRDMYSNIGDSSNFSRQSELIVKRINDARDKITELKNRNIEIASELTEVHNSLETTRDTKQALEEIDVVKKERDELKKNYEIYLKAVDDLRVSTLEADRLKLTIDNLTEELSKKEQNMYMYKSLNKDLAKYNSVYEEMTFVKMAYSAKEGIPVVLIKSYLNNVADITNELLDIAYDGRVIIDKFDITPTEFNIPFYTNGVRLNDVKFASQGELSFLSVALSFALASQSLRKYNIMLLDEVDGVLDTSNREKFIKILENQIDRIGSEQCFLITHNAMFSSYPVDIINLGTDAQNVYPLANFIEVEKIK